MAYYGMVTEVSQQVRGEWKPHLVRIVDRELAIFVSEGDEAPLKKVPPQHLKPPTPQTLNPNRTPNPEP